MASVLEDYHDAKGEAVQPYFAAFMIERGYTVASEPFERDGHNCEYLEWNRKAWAAFEHVTGRRVDPDTGVRRLYAKEFVDWLAVRAMDHLARNHVEAA